MVNLQSSNRLILGYDVFSTCLHSKSDIARLVELSSHLDGPRMLGCALQERTDPTSEKLCSDIVCFPKRAASAAYLSRSITRAIRHYTLNNSSVCSVRRISRQTIIVVARSY